MTDSARLFSDLPTEAEQDQRDRDHEVDRTPRGLVRAALAELVTGQRWQRGPATGDGSHAFDRPDRHALNIAGLRVAFGSQPLRILDVCAGAGVWSSEARRLFGLLGIPVEITAVEIREEERERLAKWADHVVIADDLDFLGTAAGGFDLAIGNPYFNGPKVNGKRDPKRALARRMPKVLACARAAILLHTTQAFQRGEVGQTFVFDHPPVLELRVGQSVRFRPKAGADSLCYSVTAWVGEREPGSAWLTKGLALDSPDRKWTEIPGAEERLGEDLPTAPGWRNP
jgi:hypothetical protein